MSWSLSLFGPFAGAILFGLAALATRGIGVPLGIHIAFNLGHWVMGQNEICGFWHASIDPASRNRLKLWAIPDTFLGH